jgi:hypothetical protein
MGGKFASYASLVLSSKLRLRSEERVLGQALDKNTTNEILKK